MPLIVFPADGVLKAAAAVVTGVLAVIILAASPRDRAARWLSTFLLLICANQVAEAFRTVASGPDAVAWYRFATIAASLDPFVFVMLASALAGRVLGWRDVALFGSPAAVLALWAGWGLELPRQHVASTYALPLWLSIYTLVAYMAALMLATRRLRAEPENVRWQGLTTAAAIVALPTTIRVADFVIPTLDVPLPGATLLVISLSSFALPMAVLALAARPGEARLPRPLVVGAVVAFAILALGKLLEITSAVIGVDTQFLPDALHMPGRAAASLRWLAFGAFISRATFQDRALVASLAGRRRAARVFVALSFLVTATVAVELAESLTPAAPTQRFEEALILLVAIALSPAFGRVVEHMAARVYGVPARGDVAAAHDVYRRAVSEAAQQGRLPSEDPELGRLREELSIDAASARALERIADDPTISLRSGSLLAGRYRVDRFVGRGSGGRVFLARDELLARDVVVKEVLPKEPGVALREARAASRIKHPAIVSVHDAIVRDDRLFIVSEYVEGTSLANLGEREKHVLEQDGERFALELLGAVAALHDAGVVHGDLAPTNVLVAGGSPKILDFGLSGSVRETTTLGPPTMARGTPGYAAPEVSEGGRPSTRTDVYALGMLIKRYVTAPRLESVVARALRADPGERWATARDMTDAAVGELSASTREGTGRRQ